MKLKVTDCPNSNLSRLLRGSHLHNAQSECGDQSGRNQSAGGRETRDGQGRRTGPGRTQVQRRYHLTCDGFHVIASLFPERLPFRDSEISIPTALTVNGRIFIAHIDHLDALTTLPEQEGPTQGTGQQLEEFSSQDLAHQLTVNGWQLFINLHDYELIYHVFGRHNFNEITANLDVFLRHFNEIQYWTVTEICLEKSLSRRVQLLRKFIKIAGQ